MLLLLSAIQAFAQDEPTPDSAPPSEDPPSEEESTEDTPKGLDFDPEDAVTPPDLSDKQLAFLEPKRQRMDALARAQTDFTSYVLEWGEVKVGLGAISVGALPRLQLGTVPTLNLLKVYNGQAKLNFLRAGPVDVAVQGAYYTLPLDGFTSSMLFGGLSSSVIIAEPWSAHLTLSYARASTAGIPDLSPMSSLLSTLSADDLQVWSDEARANGLSFDSKATAMFLRFATDIRFNRRDSLVLQGQALLNTKLDAGLSGTDELPPILGLDQAFEVDRSGAEAISEYYIATLAYQVAWNRTELRLGGGVSSLPFAWVMQSTELSWRFGGPTRREEGRMRRGWRGNRKSTDKPNEAPPPAPTPETVPGPT